MHFKIFKILHFGNSSETFFNCTILWIIKTKIHYWLKFKKLSEAFKKYFQKNNFSKMFHDCNFNQRLNLCDINNKSVKINNKVKYEYDQVNSYYFAKYIHTLILVPIFCTISIFLNIITFKISFKYKVIQTKKKEVIHKMFDDLRVKEMGHSFFGCHVARMLERIGGFRHEKLR